MTSLHRSRPAPVWRSGDVPSRCEEAELVVWEHSAYVHHKAEAVALDDVGLQLWQIIDGERSAPSLSLVLAEQRSQERLTMSVSVHEVLQRLEAIGAIRWAD